MPLERYRRLADQPAPAAADPATPELLDRVFALWAVMVGRHGPLVPPGLRRYPSLEDAAREREAALVARMRRAREEGR